jgi:AraC-like DNA-binding protein
VQIVLRGAERIRRTGVERLLSAGDLGIWDGTGGLGIEVLAPFAKRTLVFPRELVLAASPRLADVQDVPAFGSLPGARLLARYTDAVMAELPGMDEATRTTAGDVREARLEALRARARRVARARLTDPALGPEAIAAELSVSLRTLHAAFEGSGDTVSSMVRRARLARCHQDLTDANSGTVTEIAYRWGFSDATHFSQAFKREYGCSPREVRARSTRYRRAEPMV